MDLDFGKRTNCKFCNKEIDKHCSNNCIIKFINIHHDLFITIIVFFIVTILFIITFKLFR